MISLNVQTVRAVCPHDCPDTCSMVVTVEEGRAVSLRGNPDHPFTRGFLCAKVNHYLERVYHPERLLYPLRRIGPKGSGQFQRISWDEALDQIVQQFRKIAASADGPQAILPYSYAGTMGQLQGASLDRRFFHLLGASLLDRTICAAAGIAGCEITLGTRAVIDPDSVVRARYILNWGSNTSVTNMHLWALMHQARKNGARIVTIDPFQSKTAQRSDWWLPIRPGTDAPWPWESCTSSGATDSRTTITWSVTAWGPSNCGSVPWTSIRPRRCRGSPALRWPTSNGWPTNTAR